jgi:hypothetical protein
MSNAECRSEIQNFKYLNCIYFDIGYSSVRHSILTYDYTDNQ